MWSKLDGVPCIEISQSFDVYFFSLVRFDQFNSRYLRKILVRQDKRPKSSLVRLYQKLQRRDRIREEERRVEECVT